LNRRCEISSRQASTSRGRPPKSFNLINIKAGFFQHDVMPKGVFSIFKKDPVLICDLVILITVVYFIILLLLNNFEFVLRKQSNFRPNFKMAITFKTATR
jgi:hypothetical protein